MTLADLRPVYTLVGDELYFRDQFRRSLEARLNPATLEFSLFDEDLASTPLDEVLDRARTPSLMAPLQIFFLRNAKDLFGRGGAAAEPAKKSAGKKKHGDFPANLERFVRDTPGSPPPAVLVFFADHVHLPADRQRLSLEDKGRLQRIEATLGAAGELVMCAQPSEAQAVALAQRMAKEQGAELPPAGSRLLVEMLDANLALIQREVEKLCLHAPAGEPIRAESIHDLVAASHVGSAYELASRLARRERAASLACLRRIWAEEGDAGAIGLVFQLSRAFSMALILRQQQVRDRSALYQALPEGLRPPGFAADTILAISRHMPEARLRRAVVMLQAADVELRSSPPSAELIFERLLLALTAEAAG